MAGGGVWTQIHREFPFAWVVLAAPIIVLLYPILWFGFYVVHAAIVPAYSAEARLEQIDATITLEFFLISDFKPYPEDSGRYLTVRTPQGLIRSKVDGYDWAHRARTSIYVTEDRHIAVLGPDYADHLVDLRSGTVSRVFGVPPSGWTYMGAFDFFIEAPNRRILRFFPATEQEECIPLYGSGAVLDRAPRKQARSARCPRS
jgi:hypothetical protein